MSESMHGPRPIDRERQDELLLERALFGLSEADQRELDRALAGAGFADGEGADASEYDFAVAAVALALTADAVEPLPTNLRDKVMAGAKAFQALEASKPKRREEPREQRATQAQHTAQPQAQHAAQAQTQRTAQPVLRPVAAQAPSSTSSSTSRGASGLAWFVAAAAAVLALLGWWPKDEPRVPTSLEARAELLARPDTLRVDAKGQEAFAPGATGDIVWSNTAQAGFIRLVGAPANDAKVQQYQLWIFDAEQQNPIDGGVFDVPSNGEVLIPIDAKLHVAKPTLFAITLEKPGGVVVSDKERIAIVAAL